MDQPLLLPEGVHDTLSDALDIARAGEELKWTGINYSVKLAGGSGEKVEILHEVWGTARSGQCTAILGPSGAGKTSLLSILAGRTVPSDPGSMILLNGRRASRTRKVAFVEQEDALWTTATPREALFFSARMRLSSEMSDLECINLVESMIVRMGLEKCKDSMIGHPLETRGLSGGERKRVSIGLELISNARFVFLDEPTSGLDSARALDVIKTLKRLCVNEGTTVLATIHQPSSETFFEFDEVIVLSAGRTVYCGSAEGVSDFFTVATGRAFPQHHNPADFAIAHVNEILPDKFQTCPFALGIDGEDIETGSKPQDVLIESQKVQKLNRFRQMWMLAVREFLSVKRNATTLRARIGMVVGLNLVLGMVLMHAGRPSTKILDIQTHFAVLTLLCTGAMISMSNPIALTFPLERPVLTREVAGGFYSVPVYFWSKFFVEVITATFQSLLTMGIVYVLVDLQGDFWYLTLVLIALGLVASSVALLISASVDSVKTAVSFNPVLIVPQLLFAGMIVPVTKIPQYLQVFTYVSQLRYAIALLVLIEFDEDAAAQYIFEENDIHKSKAWLYLLILFLNFLAFRLAAMVVLWRRT